MSEKYCILQCMMKIVYVQYTTQYGYCILNNATVDSALGVDASSTKVEGGTDNPTLLATAADNY